MIKTADGTWMCLTPSQVLDRAGAGEELVFELKRQRNGKYHRLVFKWMSVVLANQEKYETLDQLRLTLQLRTGRVKEIVTTTVQKMFRCQNCGHEQAVDAERTVLIPESISYENMDQGEFEAVQRDYSEALLEDGIDIPLGLK